jgi:hypothetical protein
MVKSPLAVVVILCGLLVTTACASTSAGSTSASGSSTPSTSSTPSASPTASGGAPVASACGGATPVAGSTVSLTYSDNGKNLCVDLGTTVTVALQGTPVNKWQSVHSSSELILAPRLDPGFTLAAGWTGDAYEAIRPGTAYVSASRYPCGTATKGRSSMQCGVIVGYRVNITVAS